MTSVIPGARNVRAGGIECGCRCPLDGGFDVEAFDAVVREVYDRHLREAIHPLW